jgi:hypothetical protein
MLTLTPAGERSIRLHPFPRVFVYWNLHRRCWSIRAMDYQYKGIVIAHADALTLFHVEPKVSEAGRRRVIAEGVKNVHAGLVGNLDLRRPLDLTLNDSKSLAYNPRENSTFIYGRTGETYDGSFSATLTAVNGRASVKV